MYCVAAGSKRDCRAQRWIEPSAEGTICESPARQCRVGCKMIPSPRRDGTYPNASTESNRIPDFRTIASNSESYDRLR
jgi:hypothetical protein